jgi:hypothetical protein
LQIDDDDVHRTKLLSFGTLSIALFLNASFGRLDSIFFLRWKSYPLGPIDGAIFYLRTMDDVQNLNEYVNMSLLHTFKFNYTLKFSLQEWAWLHDLRMELNFMSLEFLSTERRVFLKCIFLGLINGYFRHGWNSSHGANVCGGISQK